MLSFADYKDKISKSVHYHIDNNIPFAENIYRLHSEEFYALFREARVLYNESLLTELTSWDKQLIETDIGEFGKFEGEDVPLDMPIQEEDQKDPELNKPKKGGPKKFYVFVRDGDKIKKVTWGDTTGLRVKLNDKGARKSFAARHRCDQQKDRTKAAYWACNLPRYAKSLGLSGGGNFYW
jgi:hypothetical protein|tara:strand:- start:1704 stop:2243 length:540 start_codon:yes stop_codon:yes gene_type:complete